MVDGGGSLDASNPYIFLVVQFVDGEVLIKKLRVGRHSVWRSGGGICGESGNREYRYSCIGLVAKSSEYRKRVQLNVPFDVRSFV